MPSVIPPCALMAVKVLRRYKPIHRNAAFDYPSFGFASGNPHAVMLLLVREFATIYTSSKVTDYIVVEEAI